MFDATFWLLISFIILIVLGFKKIKVNISAGIKKYQETISNAINTAEKNKKNSDIQLLQVKNKTTEIEELCKSLKQNALLEKERILDDMKVKISSYLSFKEVYFQEKIKIYTDNSILKLKEKILLSAIEIVTSYLKENSKNEKLEVQELEKLLNKF